MSYDPLLRKLQKIGFGCSLRSVKLTNIFPNCIVSGSYQLFGMLSSEIESFELNAELSDSEFQSLVRSLTKVKLLRIEKYIPNDLSLLYLAKNCPYLQVFYFDCSNISNTGLQNLTSYCQEIEHLSLGHKCNYKISEVGLKYLTDRCKLLSKLQIPQLTRVPQIESFNASEDLFSRFSFYQDWSQNLSLIKRKAEFNFCATNSFFLSIPFSSGLQKYLFNLSLSKWESFDVNLLSTVFKNVQFSNLQILNLSDVPRKKLNDISNILLNSECMPILNTLCCELQSKFIESEIIDEVEYFFIENLCKNIKNLDNLRLVNFVKIDDVSVNKLVTNFKSLLNLD